MSSIIEGYNYDIFISYRQKDNKGDRWVSEFVEALKTELEATFKEDISIYFDENPHDGLLETHDVDASLKEKLKCVIFIPVISRTFCDPKAFAWQHEFLAFIEQASADNFGLKVSLPNGNVATRVLPVRIHELGPEDTKLCEEALGTALRGVDFIYKAPGVNRPLRREEDHPKDNLNKTYYRDQINKVANAIDDILISLKPRESATSTFHTKRLNVRSGDIIKSNSWIRRTFPRPKFRGIAILFSFILFFIFTAYIINRISIQNHKEGTLAFFRIQNTFNDSSLINQASDFMEALNEKLALVKKITVKPRFITDRYKQDEKSLKWVWNDLKANYVLSGDIRRNNQEVSIWMELSETRDEKVIWNKQIIWNNELMSKNTSEIVRMIASNMGIQLTPEEERQIDKEHSSNPEENLKIISANKDLDDAWDFYNYGDKLLDSSSFKKAINSYDTIIKEYPENAVAYAKRAIARSWGFYLREFDSSSIEMCRKDIEMAIKLDREISEVEVAQGFYYYYCTDQNEKALEHFEKASLKDPGNYKPIFYMSLANRRLGKWEDCRKLIQKVTKFNPKEALFLTNIGMTYSFFHEYDSALIYQQKAIEMIPTWTAGYKNKFEVIILKNGLTNEARSLIDDAMEMTGNNMIEYRIQLRTYERKFSEALLLAERADPRDFDLPGKKYLYMARLCGVLNETGKALEYYESLRSVTVQALKRRSGDHHLHGMLGLAYAGLGDKSKALEEVEMAIKIAHEKNRMDESEMKLYRAQINTIFGDFDNAFPQILFILNNPSFFSKRILPIDPIWKPIVNHPDYKKKI